VWVFGCLGVYSSMSVCMSNSFNVFYVLKSLSSSSECLSAYLCGCGCGCVFVFLSAYLNVCLSLSVCLNVCISVYCFNLLQSYLNIILCFKISLYLSVCLFAYLASVCMCLFVCTSVSVCMSHCLSI
jgi:hypothetical protein